MNIYQGLTEDDIDELHEDMEPYFTMENFLTLLNAVAFYADPEAYRGVAIVTSGSHGEFGDDFGSNKLIDKSGEVVDVYEQPGKLARDAIQAIFLDVLADDK